MVPELPQLFWKLEFGAILTIAFSLLVAPGCQPVFENDTRPNVLFIAVDDMNDWVGVMGYSQALTPNIDLLASRGTLFADAHCAAPVCNPSRVSVLTGLHPFHSGVYENNDKMRDKIPDVVTLPQYFRKHGYKVFGGGKIFHDPPPYNHDSLSWDYYYWWNEQGPKGAFDGSRWRSPYSVPPDPELEGRPTKRITPLTKRNFDWGPVDQPISDWPDFQVSNWATEFLSQDHEKPFFLAVGIFRPHVPWFNPTQFFELYPEKEIQLPDFKPDDLDDLGEWANQRARDNASKHDSVVAFGEWESAVQAYLASITFGDAMVGRVVDALAQSEYADNTIIVLWSDHGYHLGEKHHWHKRTLWQRSTHVPLIIRTPGKPGRVACQSPVSLVDLYPTLVELCGLPPKIDLDGQSLVPLLTNPDIDWPYPAITTLRPGNTSVRTGPWAYIRYETGEEELYDRGSDLKEWKNLADQSDYSEIKEELSKYLPTEYR